MLPYIDFHTHKPLYNQDGVIEIISAHITNKFPQCIHTVGYHPWWTHTLLADDEINAMKLSLVSNTNCIALGECGLDKLKSPDLELQQQIFIQQIALANELGCPIIIHCVRQYQQLLDLRKKYGQTKWVVHGFRRNKILAEKLLDAGIYLSVSPFKEMNKSFIETLQYLPIERFFIETDSEYSYSIFERYQFMSDLKKIDTFTLRERMFYNTTQLFSWKELPNGLKEQSYW